MAVATATKKAGTKEPAVQATRAFRIGVQSHEEMNFDETRSTTTSTQDLNVLNIPPAGFLRHLYMTVTGTTAGNSAATTFAANGPFNVLDTVTLEDVNSAPIVGPLTGWDLYIINKYGGYRFSDDAKANLNSYTATTGAGATGGSFSFILRVPLELVARDALGSLPNKSGTSMFKLRVRLAATATVYGVAPTNAPSVRVQVEQVDWWDPDATDLKGRPLAQNPPAVQTTQYWSKANYPVNAGAIRQQLERNGYLIRNLIFILTDNAGSRTQGDADFPDPATLQYEANILFNRSKTRWRHMIGEDYGYTAAVETAGGRDYGVYPLPFNQDFGFKPGAETRRGYLPTSSATRMEVQGTVSGSGTHTLTVLTNDVSPARDEAELTA